MQTRDKKRRRYFRRRFLSYSCEARTADCSQTSFTVNDLRDRVNRVLAVQSRARKTDALKNKREGQKAGSLFESKRTVRAAWYCVETAAPYTWHALCLVICFRSHAGMVELVDTLAWGASGASRACSSQVLRIARIIGFPVILFFMSVYVFGGKSGFVRGYALDWFIGVIKFIWFITWKEMENIVYYTIWNTI